MYSSIFAEAQPRKIKELIQYSHIIHTASLTYVWENVYAYDIDFRLHMGKYPQRNWGIILNLAWQTRLKEKIPNQRGGRENQAMTVNRSNGKTCWKFNRGKCTYGMSCKFDHKCGICSKFGHGSHNCRKGKGGSKGQGDRDHGEGQGNLEKKVFSN